ncbi:MAG TPA: TadE/TadG family type IV pilus assembly protein [Vicinamibacterales bacterium]|nr:TadE/TadG family type IV pilus assembly protein [Vicinamibacterales bacterium]
MKRLGRFRSETGGALVELAVALPVLLVVFAGTTDLARVFYTAMALTDAARAGAQYGAFNAAQSSDTATMQTTATSATGVSGITAVATRLCQCATDAGVFSATATANDCTSPDATACPGKHRVITVTVTTSKTFTTVMGGFPAIPSSISLTRTATMRVHQ